jgi:hypothetical protein
VGVTGKATGIEAAGKPVVTQPVHENATPAAMWDAHGSAQSKSDGQADRFVV